MRFPIITFMCIFPIFNTACGASEPDEVKITEEQILQLLIPRHRLDIDLLPWVNVSVGPREKAVARRLIQKMEWNRKIYATPSRRLEFLQQGADAIILGRILNTKTNLDSYVYGTEIYVAIDQILRDSHIGLDTIHTKEIKIYTTQFRRVYNREKKNMRTGTSDHPSLKPGDKIIAGLSLYPFFAVTEVLMRGGVPPDIFEDWFYKEKLEDGFEFGGFGVWKIEDNGNMAQAFGYGPGVSIPSQALMDSIKRK